MVFFGLSVEEGGGVGADSVFVVCVHVPDFVTGYYFCGMDNVEMDHRAAWRDFFDVVRPGIWVGLSRDERRIINLAERDFHGKRGKVLGVDRVEGLLHRFSPGRYVVERRVVFRVVDGG